MIASSQKLEEMKKKELENAAEQQLKEEARKLRREEKRRQKLLQMEEVFKKRLVLKMRAQQEKQKEINREKARLEIQVSRDSGESPIGNRSQKLGSVEANVASSTPRACTLFAFMAMFPIARLHPVDNVHFPGF